MSREPGGGDVGGGGGGEKWEVEDGVGLYPSELKGPGYVTRILPVF